MKLIFVDDSEIWREEVHEIADAVGVTILTYSLPDEVDLAEVRTADAVVTDNKFGRDGYLGVDFIRSIRARGFSGRVVLYTNYPRQGDTRDVKGLGGSVVAKSVIPDTLVQSLSACREVA
jgi:DNA-binding NarL/FixJ family response regulator